MSTAVCSHWVSPGQSISSSIAPWDLQETSSVISIAASQLLEKPLLFSSQHIHFFGSVLSKHIPYQYFVKQREGEREHLSWTVCWFQWHSYSDKVDYMLLDARLVREVQNWFSDASSKTLLWRAKKEANQSDYLSASLLKIWTKIHIDRSKGIWAR